MKSTLCTMLVAAVLASVSSISYAAAIATDDASNSPYSDGWQAGDNGGTGFDVWSLAASGGGGRYIGGTGQGATSFGLYAGGGGASDLSSANRPFTGGALSAGQTFSVSIGHSNSIATGGEVGLQLLDGGTPVLTLKFVGGDSSWKLNDGGSDFGIAQGYAANTSLAFSFTYNGGSSYSYSFGSASGSNFTATSTITNITGVRFFSNRQGGGENFGANNLSVVPEPSTVGLLVSSLVGGTAMLGRRRRA